MYHIGSSHLAYLLAMQLVLSWVGLDDAEKIKIAQVISSLSHTHKHTHSLSHTYSSFNTITRRHSHRLSKLGG